MFFFFSGSQATIITTRPRARDKNQMRKDQQRRDLNSRGQSPVDFKSKGGQRPSGSIPPSARSFFVWTMMSSKKKRTRTKKKKKSDQITERLTIERNRIIKK